LQDDFQLGYAALRAGNFDDAARLLGNAADEGGDDPLAADARYLQASALVQAHRPREAETALVAFLDHAPRSLRRGKAEVMLGRLIADRGDIASARTWFEAATGDADPAIAKAARDGLDRLQ
jgi:TolA-binding protein